MKTSYVTLLVAVFVVLAVSANAQEDDCPKFCTFDYKPVCGYTGTCYRNYGNACTLKVDRCSNNKDLKAVDMARCDEARAKSNREVTMCPEE